MHQANSNQATTSPIANAPIIIPADVPIVVCYGGGVDSTAMLIEMRNQNIVPDVITFADVGSEKPETYRTVELMSAWCESVGFPAITTVRNTPTTDKYANLTGNCLSNETLPSLAFHMKSCSVKWKQVPQDYFLTGCKGTGPNARAPHPIWIDAQDRGVKICKLIGYDAGPADIRRSQKVSNPKPKKGKKKRVDPFQYAYPLQDLGWDRQDCIAAIIREGLPVPIKSACFFCPASQKWELYWLAGNHPDLFEKALEIEINAMTGHHTRFDEIEMGAGFMEMIGSGDRWPSTKTTVGLGMDFAWNHWARMNQVVDAGGKVIESRREWFRAKAARLQKDGGNAADARQCA